jgi:hypothetical protein
VNRVLRGGVSSLGCLLAAAIIVVAVPVPHASEPVTISYRSDLAELGLALFSWHCLAGTV